MPLIRDYKRQDCRFGARNIEEEEKMCVIALTCLNKNILVLSPGGAVS
jgi:hypothetical protein